MRAVRDEVDDHSFLFFNGMPTAEVTQRAYRAIGVPLYSSAAFAFAPRVALAYYDALERDDQATLAALERAFYHPLARLRAKGTGYAVSLDQGGGRARRVLRPAGSARRSPRWRSRTGRSLRASSPPASRPCPNPSRAELGTVTPMSLETR